MGLFGKRQKKESEEKPQSPKSLIACGWCGSDEGVELIEKVYQEPGVTRRFETLCPTCGEKFKQECGYGHVDIACLDERRQDLATLLNSLPDFELANSRLVPLKQLVNSPPE